MNKQRLAILLLALVLIVGLEALFTTRLSGQSASAPQTAASPAPTEGPSPSPEIDLEKTRPNEAGEIPIVMFHAFVDELDPDEEYSDDFKRYTQSFSYLKELLGRLYDMGY